MPQGGKPVKVPGGCTNCHGDAFDIIWKDGFGQTVPLERHCNRCGWAIDLETGEVRNPGRKIEAMNRNPGERKE